MTTTDYTLRKAVDYVNENYPLIARNLSPDVLTDEPDALEAARFALRYAAERSNQDETAIEDALEGFAELSFDFLKRQARFLKTGHYALDTAEGLAEALYNDESLMTGHYLTGLMMTYALWPNHARILRYFLDEAVHTMPTGCSVIEVGVGHGLMASSILRDVPESTYTGVDLSPHSLAFSRESFQLFGIDESRWQLLEGDATSADMSIAPADWLVCCEVLEHVDDPVGLLRGMQPLIKPDGKAFISTVANLEAEDHVYLFDDAAHIQRAIAEAGFTVISERALVLPGSEETTPEPLNYAAVIRLQTT